MKDLEDMGLEELVDYWTGYALISIGHGEFRRAISLMLQDTMTRAYKRGTSEKWATQK